MKGLLVKDFCIISKNKKLLGMLLFLALFVFMMPADTVGSFIISYATILGGTLVLSTISIDEFDKSTMFLMTMPIQRKTYALEKYAFSFICSFVCWSVSTAISCIVAGSDAIDVIKIALVLFVVLTLFQFIMIPVQIKFGGENGRMVLMGMVVGILVIGFVAKQGLLAVFKSEEALSLWIQGIIKLFDELSTFPLIIITIIIMAVCFAISAGISIRAMEKREF